MAEVVRMKISPAVAAYVRPGTPSEIRLQGCCSSADMPPLDRVMLLFCLSKDSDPAVRQTAFQGLQKLPGDVITSYLASDAVHPSVLDALAGVCADLPELRSRMLACEQLSPAAREMLQQAEQHSSDTVEAAAQDEELIEAAGEHTDSDDLGDLPEYDSESADSADDDQPLDEEEFQSKYKMAQIMGIAEKIKMALSGDKEWRSILVKDSNKLVSGSVIKNPRITEAEVLALVKSGIQNDEIMRLICTNKEWIKNYQIRKALVENNRTPIQAAMRFMTSLGDKDIAHLAKSKNISSVLSTQAKRLLLNKKK